MKTITLAVAAGMLATILLDGCQPHPQQEIENRGEGKENWYDALPREAWSSFEKVEQSQPWFAVYEIVPDVFAIYEPGQFDEVISYLILGSEKALLFDTGLGIGDVRRLVSELTALPVVVVNSHTHYDHVGGNHQFGEVFCADNEFARNNARGRTHEEVREFVGEGWIWKPLPQGFAAAGYVSEPFEITRSVHDGEMIQIGGRTLEVFLTPGHSPDSLCLLDRGNRLLFVGDTFYPASLYAHLHGSDFAAYEKTATRLANLVPEVDSILPAHNEPLLDSEYLIRFRDAFEAMESDKTPFALTDGNREYFFKGFSIIVADPPPWIQ